MNGAMRDSEAPPRRPRLSAAALAAVVALGAVLALTTARFVMLAWRELGWPYEIDYGEGIVWQQMRMIAAGRGYAPLLPYPAIVFHYPPVFHLLARAVAALGVDELMAGRLVALGCTIAGLVLAGLVVAALGRDADEARRLRRAGVAAALILPATRPVLVWAVIMRADMPFVALSFAGLWCGTKALERPGWVHAAALCFVAAIFTKQTAIAAPLAVFAVLLATRPRTALAGIATGLAVSLAALAWLQLATHGEFLRHIVLYNMNRFWWAGGRLIWSMLTAQAGLVAAALLGLAPRLAGLKAWRRDPAAARLAMLASHFAIATMMLAMLFKSGSAINYFLEWLWLAAICAGLAFGDFLGWAEKREARRWWPALAPLLLGAQALGSWLLIKDDLGKRAVHRADFDRMAAAMRAAPEPVLSDDMVLILRAGKQVMVEPAVFAELTARHQLDDRPLLKRLERHEFSMVVTEGWPGDKVFDARYTQAMARAIVASYPQQIELAGWYVVRLPAGPLPAWAAGLDE